MARLVVSAAIGVAVGYFAGPVAGFQAFGVAYGATGFLDPNKHVLGPKLNDLRAPTASYGAPITYLRGTHRLAGNVIWSSEKREIATTESQGKGGPGVDSTTYTYEIDLLIEVTINRAHALRRVFSNGKLVWTNGESADDATFTASSTTVSWRDIRFYGGDDDQLPDPTYEAAVGIGNAPAYRGRGTIAIDGLSLGGSGQLPILTFEVVAEEGASEFVSLQGVTVTNGVGGPGAAGIGTASFDPAGYTLHIPMWNANYASTQVNVYDMGATPPVITSSYFVSDSISLNVMIGTTDQSCLVLRRGGTSQVLVYEDDGTLGTYDFSGIGGPTARDRFARKGEVIVFGSNLAGDNKIYRAAVGGGVAAVVSAALPTAVQALAISSDSFVYAVSSNGASLYKLDVATLTLQETIPMPSTLGSETVFSLTLDGATPYVRGSGLYSYSGSAWHTVIATLPLELRVDSNVQNLAVHNGTLTSIYRSAGTPPINNVVWSYRPSTPAQTATLADVVRDLCLRTGQLTADDLDVTDLEGDVVRAMAISQVSTTRSTIEMLMGAYLFEAVESDKIKFVKRGGATVVSIPYEDLGAGDGTAEPLPVKRANDSEIAARVSVKFANVLNNYQDGLEAADRLVTQSTAESVIEVPLGFTPVEAKKLADANTMDLAVSLVQIGPISVTRQYAKLEPTDPIHLTDANGNGYRARIVKATVGTGTYTFDLVVDDASVVASAALTDSDYSATTLIKVLASTSLQLLDIPLLRDADNSPGFYAAFGATGTWPGAELDRSTDNVTYTKKGSASDRAVMGVTE